MEAGGEGFRYEFSRPIEEGAYGAVYSAVQRPSGVVVAVKVCKHVHQEGVKRLLLREIKVLRALPAHPCVVRLLDAFRSQATGRAHLVFELMDRSLHQELDFLDGEPMFAAQLKVITFQLVLGLAHCHSQRVIHRDIKPANVLLSGNGTSCVAKLCDFGFARFVSGPSYHTQERLSTYVVTRWYRAPEILVGGKYGLPSDVWGLGCTLAEMATGDPLFPGSSTLDQLARIMRCFGSLPPTLVDQLLTVERLAPLRIPPPRSRTLQQRLPSVSSHLLDLISACLTVDPNRRPAARDLLRMPFFRDIPRLLSGTPLEGLLHLMPGASRPDLRATVCSHLPLSPRQQSSLQRQAGTGDGSTGASGGLSAAHRQEDGLSQGTQRSAFLVPMPATAGVGSSAAARVSAVAAAVAEEPELCSESRDAFTVDSSVGTSGVHGMAGGAGCPPARWHPAFSEPATKGPTFDRASSMGLEGLSASASVMARHALQGEAAGVTSSGLPSGVNALSRGLSKLPSRGRSGLSGLSAADQQRAAFVAAATSVLPDSQPTSMSGPRNVRVTAGDAQTSAPASSSVGPAPASGHIPTAHAAPDLKDGAWLHPASSHAALAPGATSASAFSTGLSQLQTTPEEEPAQVQPGGSTGQEDSLCLPLVPAHTRMHLAPGLSDASRALAALQQQPQAAQQPASGAVPSSAAEVLCEQSITFCVGVRPVRDASLAGGQEPHVFLAPQLQAGAQGLGPAPSATSILTGPRRLLEGFVRATTQAPQAQPISPASPTATPAAAAQTRPASSTCAPASAGAKASSLSGAMAGPGAALLAAGSSNPPPARRGRAPAARRSTVGCFTRRTSSSQQGSSGAPLARCSAGTDRGFGAGSRTTSMSMSQHGILSTGDFGNLPDHPSTGVSTTLSRAGFAVVLASPSGAGAYGYRPLAPGQVLPHCRGPTPSGHSSHLLVTQATLDLPVLQSMDGGTSSYGLQQRPASLEFESCGRHNPRTYLSMATNQGVDAGAPVDASNAAGVGACGVGVQRTPSKVSGWNRSSTGLSRFAGPPGPADQPGGPQSPGGARASLSGSHSNLSFLGPAGPPIRITARSEGQLGFNPNPNTNGTAASAAAGGSGPVPVAPPPPRPPLARNPSRLRPGSALEPARPPSGGLGTPNGGSSDPGEEEDGPAATVVAAELRSPKAGKADGGFSGVLRRAVRALASAVACGAPKPEPY
ncbi:hypothetical protein HYH03_006066 [Edaphochlamys debaryana]|uniref:Protein kinase domain-containing protein n=1 Tax=Edaphochlamys debaryana TaxID=47281 RepID=A0A835Y3J1_9CHLO|nr:hypothetical protein HYH03_006066 [Edaphochlamys debaryana]|eukprot:KAG2495827.1 hypothetical protein HYH03_006066 [Edaphochlamys debaryana]